jgi:hypothetical protein
MYQNKLKKAIFYPIFEYLQHEYTKFIVRIQMFFSRKIISETKLKSELDKKGSQ